MKREGGLEIDILILSYYHNINDDMKLNLTKYIIMIMII